MEPTFLCAPWHTERTQRSFHAINVLRIFFPFRKSKMSQPQHRCLLRPVGSEVEFSSPPFPPSWVARAESKEKEGRKRGEGFSHFSSSAGVFPDGGKKWIGGGGKRLLNGWLEGARENVSARLCRWCEKKSRPECKIWIL